MITSISACKSARTQYRAAFKAMAADGIWHLYAGSAGVVLDRAGDQSGEVLVHHVEAMTEDTLVVKLSDRLARGWPEKWSKA